MPSLEAGLFATVAAVVGRVTPDPPPMLSTCEPLWFICDEFGLALFEHASALYRSYSIFIFSAD